MDTCYYPHIQGSVYFSVEGNGFDVYVKEVEMLKLDYVNGGKVLQMVVLEDESQIPVNGERAQETNHQKPIIDDVN